LITKCVIDDKMVCCDFSLRFQTDILPIFYAF